MAELKVYRNVISSWCLPFEWLTCSMQQTSKYEWFDTETPINADGTAWNGSKWPITAALLFVWLVAVIAATA